MFEHSGLWSSIYDVSFYLSLRTLTLTVHIPGLYKVFPTEPSLLAVDIWTFRCLLQSHFFRVSVEQAAHVEFMD